MGRNSPRQIWADVDDVGLDEFQAMVRGLDETARDPFVMKNRAEVLDRILEHNLAGLVVDIGCGTGDALAEVATITSRRAVGFDRSSRMTEEARRRHAMEFVTASADRLPLAANSVAIIRAEGLVKHLPELLAAILEWRRVLKPGGLLVTADTDVEDLEIVGPSPDDVGQVTQWLRDSTRGSQLVSQLANTLKELGFYVDVIEARIELRSLSESDRMFGLPDWGQLAVQAGYGSPTLATRWRSNVIKADSESRLRYSCRHQTVFATWSQ